jgi:hypothetical protein
MHLCNCVVREIQYLCITQGQVLSYGITGAAVSMPEIWVNGVQVGSWDSAFYLTGLFGWLWLPTYYFLYDSPTAHPSISKEEREFVIKGQ